IVSKVLVTFIYAVLFAVGLIGNSMTLTKCPHKSIHLQSTVHYHLASLAVSDLLILVLCMPVELYNFIWIHHPWAFGEVVCRGYYFVRVGCSYATALNIVSLSVERYMALSPIQSQESDVPRAHHLQSICTTVASFNTAKTVLQVNALLSFVVPMLLITVMNGLIGHQLQRMTHHDLHCSAPSDHSVTAETHRERSLHHGVKVLHDNLYLDTIFKVSLSVFALSTKIVPNKATKEPLQHSSGVSRGGSKSHMCKSQVSLKS
uniref:G-protein coupled receptors family 1 profile domain-containing protein n=1 Tax=Sinocyclocheilus rhinocerous TaxID=307959 RepID=A0A673HBS4_9TELE